jgi:hypothetical protein
MNKGAAERKRREMIDAGEQEEQAARARADHARNVEEQARIPRLLLQPEAAYANLPMAQQILGSGDQALDALPRYVVGGVECVSLSEMETVCDSGRLGIGRIGRIEVLKVMALSELDNFTAYSLGVREPPRGFEFKGGTDLRPYLEVGGQAAGRIDPVVRKRYEAGGLDAIVPCEIGLRHDTQGVLYIRALGTEPPSAGPEMPTAGGESATAPPAAPAVMKEAETDLDEG